MDIFINALWLAAFFGIWAAPALLFTDVRVSVLFVVMVAIFAYFLFVRRIIKSALYMFLAHLPVPIAAGLLARGLVPIIFYLGLTVVLTLFSLYQRFRRIKTPSSEFVAFSPVVLILSALLVGYYGHGNMYLPYAALVIFLGVGGRFHNRMSMVDTSLDVISQNSTQPLQKILAFDYRAMVVLGVLLVGVILLLNRLVTTPFLRLVTRLNPNFNLTWEGQEGDFDWMFARDPMAGSLPMDEIFYYSEPWLIWQVLERFLTFVALPAAGIVAMVMLFHTLRNIYSNWRFKPEIESELDDGREDVKEFLSGTPLGGLWRRRTPRNEHRLRRLFRETMTRHIKKGAPIQKSDTPLQMTGKVQTEDISGLAEEYGAVRYGGSQ